MQEWKIGDHKARFDNKEGIMYLHIGGEGYTAENNREFQKISEEVFAGMEDNRNVMVILENSDSIHSMTKDARKEMMDDMKKTGGMKADKTAIIGASPSVRMFTKVLLKISGVKNNKFFATQDEAKAWFNE